MESHDHPWTYAEPEPEDPAVRHVQLQGWVRITGPRKKVTVLKVETVRLLNRDALEYETRDGLEYDDGYRTYKPLSEAEATAVHGLQGHANGAEEGV